MYHPMTFRKIAVTVFALALSIGVGFAQQKGKKKPVKRPNPAMAEVVDVEGLPGSFSWGIPFQSVTRFLFVS